MPALCDDQLETTHTAEVHWSTGTILAVFFASSLISAVFFGLGYSFVRGGNTKPAVASTEVPAVSQSSSHHAAGAFSQGAAARTDPTVTRDSGGYTMVQVEASANRKEAERLVVRLRKKGFRAGIYRGRHDRFLHIQVGPYKNEQEAQSARHRLIASGYHAILKTAS